jgi:hypothetical protein
MPPRQQKDSTLAGSTTTGGDNSSDDNFKVVIRVRPPLPRELESQNVFENIIKIDESHKEITVSENLSMGTDAEELYNHHTFTFDYVYDQNSKQAEVYSRTAREAVFSTLEGYNATIIAYGQTGTGKTYTMEGFTSDEKRGIIPRATEEIFNYIQTSGNPKTKFLVRASYLQIYQENVSDLLKPDRTHLTIREDKKKGVYVDNLSEWVVRSPTEIYQLMDRGTKVRATGSTNLNDFSSRSHAVFIIIVEQHEQIAYDHNGDEIDFEEYRNILAETGKFDGELRESFKIGKLNLVDLAGSERVRYSGATGRRLEESKKINKTLSALGNVIAALTDPKGRQHIPYRDSKLTRLLEDSLGGNCKTTMMAMISPALEAFGESLSTLKFVHRAKSIKNQAQVNEDLDQRALLRRYEQELKKLRGELAAKNKNIVDKKRLLELEQEKKRAEDDKKAAISALTQKTEEFLKEQQTKRDLENRIATMQSQLLVGGEKIEETPMFKNLVKQEHARVHRIYLNKLQALERERQSIEEDKAQVDRYKQLLLKQRDIMIALTARLNERDEYILNLQEELDAYDRHQKMLEDTLTKKTEVILQYENAIRNGGDLGAAVALSQQTNTFEDDNRKLSSTVNHLNLKLKKLQDENERLQQQVRDDAFRPKLNNGYDSYSSNATDSPKSSQPDKQQLQVLKQQCITKEKEKQALKTILETRVVPELEKIFIQVGQLADKRNNTQVEEARNIISDLSDLLNASIAAIAIRKPNQTGSQSSNNNNNNSSIIINQSQNGTTGFSINTSSNSSINKSNISSYNGTSNGTTTTNNNPVLLQPSSTRSSMFHPSYSTATTPTSTTAGSSYNNQQQVPHHFLYSGYGSDRSTSSNVSMGRVSNSSSVFSNNFTD